MKELYTRMNERIAPNAALVNETVNAATASVPRREKRRLVLIPVLTLMLALVIATPALAAESEVFNELLYRIVPDLALHFRPINLSDTDQGITVSVLAVDDEAESIVMYVAVQGEGINETTELYDNYHFDSVSGCSVRFATRESYDPETHTAVFRILFVQGHGALGNGKKATFQVHRILTERTAKLVQAPEYRVTAEPAETMAVGELFRSASYPADMEQTETVLKPGTLNIPIAPGTAITASGIVDGWLRIQVRTEQRWAWGEFQMGLIHPRYEKQPQLHLGYGVGIQASLTFADPMDENAVYTDYFFTRHAHNMTDYNLYVQYVETDKAIDGNWSITFPLEEYAPAQPDN